ncbi:hypothetical protein H312_00757 [Anncaliia algerae PRA339]|uniref:Uncharacterized protein n=1 Tax=Anncaliia algerae PRA339 TaxID=1288291 RepID=A0A059F3J3_9MICR|nr:hypothetical protein H312_00757 [Anncaliia algerae PRA339]
MDQEVMDGIVISYTKILQEIKSIKQQVNRILLKLENKEKIKNKAEKNNEPIRNFNEGLNQEFFKSLENE